MGDSLPGGTVVRRPRARARIVSGSVRATRFTGRDGDAARNAWHARERRPIRVASGTAARCRQRWQPSRPKCHATRGPSPLARHQHRFSTNRIRDVPADGLSGAGSSRSRAAPRWRPPVVRPCHASREPRRPRMSGIPTVSRLPDHRRRHGRKHRPGRWQSSRRARRHTPPRPAMAPANKETRPAWVVSSREPAGPTPSA